MVEASYAERWSSRLDRRPATRAHRRSLVPGAPTHTARTLSRSPARLDNRVSERDATSTSCSKECRTRVEATPRDAPVNSLVGSAPLSLPNEACANARLTFGFTRALESRLRRRRNTGVSVVALRAHARTSPTSRTKRAGRDHDEDENRVAAQCRRSRGRALVAPSSSPASPTHGVECVPRRRPSHCPRAISYTAGRYELCATRTPCRSAHLVRRCPRSDRSDRPRFPPFDSIEARGARACRAT